MSETTQLIIAIATLITALTAAVTSIVNVVRLTRVADNVHVIEKATNSMKDALVLASKEASLAEGTAVGLAQGRAESIPQKVEVVNMTAFKKEISE